MLTIYTCNKSMKNNKIKNNKSTKNLSIEQYNNMIELENKIKPLQRQLTLLKQQLNDYENSKIFGTFDLQHAKLLLEIQEIEQQFYPLYLQYYKLFK